MDQGGLTAAVAIDRLLVITQGESCCEQFHSVRRLPYWFIESVFSPFGSWFGASFVAAVFVVINQGDSILQQSAGGWDLVP